MRIAIDVTIQSQPVRTGVQRAQVGLLSALASLPSDHDFLLVSQRTVPPAVALPSTWRRHVLPSRRPGPIWREVTLLRFLQRRRFDLYHSPVSAIPRGGPVPRLATVHEVPWLTGAPRLDRGRRWNHRLALRHAVRRAAAIVVPSRATADAIAKRYPSHRTPLHVVPHGIDSIFFEPPQRSREELLEVLDVPRAPYVLSVGAERIKKNHTLISRALDDPRLSDVQWLAAGATPQSRLAAHPRRHGLGIVDDATLQDLYAHALALVFPSFSEGFGLPPLEAMAAGCPAIVSDRAALPEVVGDVTAPIDPRDANALADEVARLREDDSYRQSKQAAGRARAETFTWDRAASALLGVYQRIGERS